MSDYLRVIRTTISATLFLALIFWLIPLTYAQHETEKQVEQKVEKEEQYDAKEAEEYFKAGEMIVEHITDSYEWHIMSIGETHISIPLPVILYDQGKWILFSSSHFHHGEHLGYAIAESGANQGKIVRKDSKGVEIRPDLDISFTKNVLAIFLSLTFMLIIFISIAKSYKRNPDHSPKGLQSFLEPIILFVRDDIAKASIGEKKYEK